MEWNVKNAVSRDVERQHLNKILKDIRSTVEQLTVGNVAAPPTPSAPIVVPGSGSGGSSGSNLPTTVTLTGDVTGTSVTTGSNSVSIVTSLSENYVLEAPIDSEVYWRGQQEWKVVPVQVQNLEYLLGSGYAVIDQSGVWYSRQIESDSSEIEIVNPDGVAGNTVISLAKVALEAGDTIHNNRVVMSVDGLALHPDVTVRQHGVQVVGVSTSSGNIGDSITIKTDGRLSDDAWSWEPGYVYCGQDGVLTQAPDAAGWLLVVATVINPTTIDVDIQTTFFRG